MFGLEIINSVVFTRTVALDLTNRLVNKLTVNKFLKNPLADYNILKYKSIFLIEQMADFVDPNDNEALSALLKMIFLNLHYFIGIYNHQAKRLSKLFNFDFTKLNSEITSRELSLSYKLEVTKSITLFYESIISRSIEEVNNITGAMELCKKFNLSLFESYFSFCLNPTSETLKNFILLYSHQEKNIKENIISLMHSSNWMQNNISDYLKDERIEELLDKIDTTELRNQLEESELKSIQLIESKKFEDYKFSDSHYLFVSYENSTDALIKLVQKSNAVISDLEYYGTDFIFTLIIATNISIKESLQEKDFSLNATIKNWAIALCRYCKTKGLMRNQSFWLRGLYYFILSQCECAEINSLTEFDFSEFEIEDKNQFKEGSPFFHRQSVNQSTILNHIINLAIKTALFTNKECDLFKCIPLLVLTEEFKRDKIVVEIPSDLIKINCKCSFNKLGKLVICILNENIFRAI
jgi:hypothetical protein